LVLGNWHDMVYHAALGHVVLVNGGPEQGKPAADPLALWGWDGAHWSLLSADAAGPRWRNFASITYDEGREVLVLYGGLDGDGRELEETWEWDGHTWAQRQVPGPGGREAAALAYDSARGLVVLFGGASRGVMQAETWTWDGQAWRQAASGPPARFPGGFVFDPLRAEIVLAGGHSLAGNRWSVYGDTWTWDGAMWREVDVGGPSPRDGARAVFDPASGRVLLFGGVQTEPTIQFMDDTWAWDGEQWTQLEAPGPAGRAHHGLVYDAARGRIVLAGGAGEGGRLLPDVWEWVGEGWRCALACE
jgi:hypothetical protein